MKSSTNPEIVVCTLLEKDYHLGLAALVNSLHRNGWNGTLYAGIRGPLPPWTSAAAPVGGGMEWTGGRDWKIRFIPVDPPGHLTFHKPRFIQEVFERHAPSAAAVMYFDPDIVVKAPWSFFCQWVDDRIALCEDLNWSFPRSHPIRRQWAATVAHQGLNLPGGVDAYYNAGFVGVARKHRAFLDQWLIILSIIEPLLEQCQEMTIADRSFAFHKGDQDALNIAVEFFSDALSTIGPEGMDFVHGGYTMSHAVGTPKPWKKSFILCALSGNPPSFADKGFVENIAGPIPVCSGLELLWKQWSIRLGSGIGRFIRRN